jgi:hypothetical protein
MPSAPGRVILKDPAQRSITIMPILVTRKGTFRSLIHAANLVNLLFAFVERPAEDTMSSVSAFVACPDRAQLMIASP